VSAKPVAEEDGAGSTPRPPGNLIAWVEQTLGSHARVTRWKRLTGGLTSLVYELTVEPAGRREQYVLRWWEPASEWQEWRLRAVPMETAVLTRLAGTGIPAPRVIASTTDTAHGSPAVLMTCLPGQMQLMPVDREIWLREMAQMLARIHSLTIEAKPFKSWLDPGRLSPPADATAREVWKEAIAVAAGDRAPTRTCFLHRDYQHFNMLWSGERLTGVVDWSEACMGPPEIDVGHCRLNLTLLFSAEVADRFREIYEVESGHKVDAWWDLQALLAYDASWKQFLPIQIDGRAPLEVRGMTRRMEQVLQGCLRHL
jgi:aminoglycoside phosphotransferase (APT) family kinase protein